MTANPNHHFGKRLRELRLRAGKSQVQVAREIDMNQTAISNSELNRVKPQHKTILRWAEYYGVSPDYLLGHPYNPKQTRESAIAIDAGKAIRFIRRAKGLSLEALARKMDIDPSAVSYFETRATKHRPSVIRRYADALGVDYEYIVELAGKGEFLPAFPQKPVINRCSHCGYEREGIAIFCPHCGSDWSE